MEKNILIMKNYNKGIIVVLIILLIALLYSTSAKGDSTSEIELNFSFTEPTITDYNISNTTYHNVTMNETNTTDKIGLPMLPVKSLHILLPQKGILETINVNYSGNTSMGYGYNVTLGGLSSNQSNGTNFNSSKPYPQELVRKLGIYYFRGYSILTCHLYPVHYINDTGEIYYYENMTLTVRTNNTGSVSRFFRGLERDEISMKDLVDDYSMNNTYTSMLDPPANSTIVHSGQQYDFVIITKEDFVNANCLKGVRESSWKTFQDLAKYKNDYTDFKTIIVTIEEIISDPAYYNTGVLGDGDSEVFDDTQCRIRNFIKHAYLEWGTLYFLLGGDNSTESGEELLPARNMWYKWEGDTDKFHEGELPSDWYYSCLAGSFNEDEDDIWGAPWDGAPSGDLDEPLFNPVGSYFYAEADPDQHDVNYEVGLFTPPLNMEGYNTFHICILNEYFSDEENEIAQVRVYSNGTDYETNREKTIPMQGAQSYYINSSGFENKGEVYVEFYYRNDGLNEGRSANIDNIVIESSSPYYVFLREDFEIEWIENEDGDMVPDAGWIQKKYNGTEGSWAREYYHVDVYLMGDVCVGRAPVGNSKEVSNFVTKTINYEITENTHWSFFRALMVGGILGMESGSDSCKAIIEYLDGRVYENGLTELYDKSFKDLYSNAELFFHLNFNPHIVYDHDHGVTEGIYYCPGYNQDSFCRFHRLYSYFLINPKPFFMYGANCLIGAFDNFHCYRKYPLREKGIYHKWDCLAEYLTVKTKHGAFAVVMNSRESFTRKIDDEYWQEWFFKYIYKEGLGEVNRLSKNELGIDTIWDERDDHKWRMLVYERNLLGDPTVTIKRPSYSSSPVNPTIKGYTLLKKTGSLYKYSFYANTSDIDGDQVSYKWKYNNIEMPFWTKYYNSDENMSKTLWLPVGTYNISVKSRDIFGNESNWSDPLPITVSFDSNIQIESTTAVLGEELQLIGQASGGSEPYATWYYDLGDGNNSQTQNTTHTYNALANYTVTLNVTDNQNISSNYSMVVNTVILNSDFEISPGPSISILQEIFYFNDKSKGYYDIVNWSWDFGDGNISYDRNTSHVYSSEGAYNVTLNVTGNESNMDNYYQMIYIDSVSPTITSVSSNFDIVGYGSNVTISVNTSDGSCGLKTVKVNITYPDSSSGNFTMNNTVGSIYEYVFSDCWQLCEYNYTVWVADNADNDNYSSEHGFVVSRIYGYNKIGGSNQTIWDTITGSVFMVNEKGVADNISVYLDPGNASSDFHYTCVIYRHNDSVLVGTSEEKNISSSKGWQTFNFSVPKPVLMNDTEYVLGCWSDNYTVKMYYDNTSEEEMFYDDGTSTLRGHYFEGFYNYTPGINNFDHENRKYSIYCGYTPDNTTPEITNISDTPDPVGFGFNVTITADVVDDASGVDFVKVNITYPNSSVGSFTMDYIGNDTYEYIFTDTWLKGQYNYLIWAVDHMNNSNSSSGHSFTVSAQATVSVCTLRDSYGSNESVNLTDPPGGSPLIGYELLDDGKVLHIWNKYDNYYFDTSSGIQITNHYEEYWSHNVLMLGYYNNDVWNLIYRTDELSGFNKDIDSDGETFVNATIWKNLTYKGYDFRLAIRYHLGVDDNELTVIPYIKNLDEDDIPYVLGFGWEMKDIQIDMTPDGDYIDVNQTMYYLNQTLNNVYTDLMEPEFYLMENITDMCTKSLYLKWNQSLTYKLQVKSRDGQYNAPVTLFVRIGTLAVDQVKHTEMYWYDAEQATYYFNSYDTGEAWPTTPEYMVDGSTSNDASTTLDSDVELCDGNNCSGADLGTISKVELRVWCYYTGELREIILRPVFGGTTDGLNYRSFPPPCIGDSSWFDITYDPFAPQSWSWTDVLNLDCDVESGTGMMEFTLYCSMVEVRVTYTPWYPPVVSDPYPSDGSNGISIAPMLNITVSDEDGDNMDISWLSNSSGSWQVFGTNNSVGNGTYHQTMSNASVNGQWWYWKVNVTDGSNYTESSVYKFYTGYQSKITNTGSTNIKGYLLIQVQYYNTSNSTWVVADDTVNESSPRTINSSAQFGLDTVFNGLVNTSNLSGFGNGTYRIYAKFRDPSGNVLVCDDDTEMIATYEFTITFD